MTKGFSTDESGLRQLWDDEVRFYEFRDTLPNKGKGIQRFACGETANELIVVQPPNHPGTYDQLSEAIESCRAESRKRGLPIEWRTWGHDQPDELPRLLAAAGFVADPTESLLIGIAREVAAQWVTPLLDGMTTRVLPADEVDARLVPWLYANDCSPAQDVTMIPDFVREGRAEVHVVEHDGDLVASSWLTRKLGTSFACVAGGCTRGQDQNRGIQKFLIVERAKSALRNHEHLYAEVGPNSPQSESNLRKLGFNFASTETSYRWTFDG